MARQNKGADVLPARDAPKTNPARSLSAADEAVKAIAGWATDCEIRALRARERGGMRGLDEAADWVREARNVRQLLQIAALAAGRHARLLERQY